MPSAAPERISDAGCPSFARLLFSEVWSSKRTQSTPSVRSLDVQARDYVDPVALDRFGTA
jgi:hypothetical protein